MGCGQDLVAAAEEHEATPHTHSLRRAAHNRAVQAGAIALAGGLIAVAAYFIYRSKS